MSTINRSSLPETRNPLLRLPAAKTMAGLLPSATAALVLLLGEASRDCRAKAEYSWQRKKPPQAHYWAKWAVEMRHARLLLNRAIRPSSQPLIAVQQAALVDLLADAKCTCNSMLPGKGSCPKCRLEAQVAEHLCEVDACSAPAFALQSSLDERRATRAAAVAAPSPPVDAGQFPVARAA